MAAVIPNTAEIIFLEKMKEILNTGIAKLFKNDKVPAAGDNAGDYVEADFTGYASKALNNWGAAFTNGNGDAQTDETLKVWTQTGVATTCDVYGYYVVDGNGALLYAERNPAGVVAMDTNGKTYAVLFRFVARSMNP